MKPQIRIAPKGWSILVPSGGADFPVSLLRDIDDSKIAGFVVPCEFSAYVEQPSETVVLEVTCWHGPRIVGEHRYPKPPTANHALFGPVITGRRGLALKNLEFDRGDMLRRVLAEAAISQSERPALENTGRHATEVRRRLKARPRNRQALSELEEYAQDYHRLDPMKIGTPNSRIEELASHPPWKGSRSFRMYKRCLEKRLI